MRSGMEGKQWGVVDERGVAIIAVLSIAMVLTTIGLVLVGLMHTDITHASIQHAKTSSYAIAQAGLTEAQAAISGAPDPATYATSTDGVAQAYGRNGQFTYWVDAGPAAGSPCGPGLKTLEALGEVAYLGRMITSRVRACGVPGVAYLTALFGESLIESGGATSRTYIAPYLVGRPGAPRGGAVGSFNEINFSDSGLRLNAVSENNVETVMLRDGTFNDYELFGFSSRPTYESNPSRDPVPWITSVFGDILKAQPSTGPVSNRCGTPFACVTVRNGSTDVPNIADLRADEGLRHVYMNTMTQQVLPELSLDPAGFRSQAAANANNQAINTAAGLIGKSNSVYTPAEFDQLVTILATRCPPACLRGQVFVDGSFELARSVNLGGNSGDVTLAVQGDLIVTSNTSLTIRHDLSTVRGRQTPGILIFGTEAVSASTTNACGGQRGNGSGRLILCGGSHQRLTVDGLIYTVDGMAIRPQATVDQIGAMYHRNAGTTNPSFSNQNSSVVLRFDPLALSAFGRGITLVSWQQIR